MAGGLSVPVTWTTHQAQCGKTRNNLGGKLGVALRFLDSSKCGNEQVDEHSIDVKDRA
jgi:hypothetical protein